MGLGILAKRWLREQQRQKAEQRAREAAEREAAREAFHRDWWDRQRVAEALGVSTHRLKRMMAAQLGPVPAKAGPHKQSRTMWAAAEVRRYLADPPAYERAKVAAS